MESVKTKMKSIACDMIERLQDAGYPPDHPDNGWAFDRAVRYLNLYDFVGSWEEEDWEIYSKIEEELVAESMPKKKK